MTVATFVFCFSLLSAWFRSWHIASTQESLLIKQQLVYLQQGRQCNIKTWAWLKARMPGSKSDIRIYYLYDRGHILKLLSDSVYLSIKWTSVTWGFMRIKWATRTQWMSVIIIMINIGEEVIWRKNKSWKTLKISLHIKFFLGFFWTRTEKIIWQRFLKASTFQQLRSRCTLHPVQTHELFIPLTKNALRKSCIVTSEGLTKPTNFLT